MSKTDEKEYKPLTQAEILETPMGVYDKFQANLVNNKWEKNGAVLQNTCKVFKGFTENHNKNFEGTGSFYVLNKKKDAEYQKAAKEKRAAMAKNARAETEKEVVETPKVVAPKAEAKKAPAKKAPAKKAEAKK